MNNELPSKKNLLTRCKSVNLRSDETKAIYQKFIKTNKKKNCIYCDRELFVKEFKHWMILENRFPYDKVAKLSHMLCPKRHVSGEENLTLAEIYELKEIKKKHLGKYSAILESPPNKSTKPNHYHVHLLQYYKK